MKALILNPEHRAIEPMDVKDQADIARLIGYDTIESDAIGTAADRRFFDEECFLRGAKGRFQIDSVIPVSGKPQLISTADEGKTLRDVATDIDGLRSRIKYL